MMSNSVTEDQEIAERQIDLFIEQFSERYGEDYAAVLLEYACHAAFPSALTTELAYLLRQRMQEEYEIDLPWTAAPELLLSGLCDVIGSDLYSMDGDLRKALWERLVDYYGVSRIKDLSNWMASYIKYRIQVDKRLRANILGEPVKWIALACLNRDNPTTNEIKKYCIELLQKSEDLSDLIRWSSMDESTAGVLEELGLEPLDREELMQAIAEWRSIDDELPEVDRVRKSMATAGFPNLQSRYITYNTIEISETAIETGDALFDQEFEIVKVDATGKIITPSTVGTAKVFKEPLATDVGLEMVAIPSGKFMMGSPKSEINRYKDESPEHEVTVQPFFIGKYPVTQVQWQVIANTPKIERELKPNPSRFTNDSNLPLERVSWEEAVEFCARLSRETGRDYRLPTEAEWEYACRAGTKTPFHFGQTITGKLVNYDSGITYAQERKVKMKGKTTPVGTYPPNAFGLCDMHGNVWEWCLDHWHGNYEGAPTNGSAWISGDNDARRVRRGGSWDDDPGNCRSATRYGTPPDFRDIDIGFRVVCEITRTP
jgi:formylglycine-generating enzyme required for sulfatase activity